MCGNGILETGEQCDDGNVLDLDGCNSKCAVEIVTRMSTIQISAKAGPSFCVHNGNALGVKAITSLALGQLNPPLATDVTNGTVNVLTQFITLSDPLGQNATGFNIGVLDGTVDPAKGAWPTTGSGAMPEDWLFLADPAVVLMGLPTGILTKGKLASGTLTAGPSSVNLTLNLGGSPAALQMNNATINGVIANSKSAPGDLPATMKVQAGFEQFDSISATTDGSQGLCGDITAASLAQIPVPSALTSGTGNCTQKYTPCVAPMTPTSSGSTCNSLLDVLVGGCSVFGGLVTAINATQPDVAGNGGNVTKLTPGANKKVTVAAGDNDAYSAYLTFAAERAHFSGESCTTNAQCQTGQTCTNKVCTPR